MTGSGSTTADAVSDYNLAAIEFAAKVHELRADAEPDHARRSQRPLDQLVPAFNRTAVGVQLEYERMGNRPVSVQLQDRATAARVQFEHLGLTIGTVLHAIDLRRCNSPEAIQLIRDTLLERKVIFFRDQNLTEDEHVTFARKFGELDAFPFGTPGENPYILEIAHGPGSPGSENGWHTDVTWMQNPSLGSIAQCTTTPPFGGDTLFSDSHAAYLGLDPAVQSDIEFLSGVNDYRLFLAGRGSGALPQDLVDQIKAAVPFGVEHPLVRTHPETGKAALYIHGGFLRHDSLFDSRTNEPLGNEASRALVRVLLAQHGRPEYHCRFEWQPGSVAFWDNRAVQHYAASDYYPHRRVLRRVTVTGDRPYYDPQSGSR